MVREIAADNAPQRVRELDLDGPRRARNKEGDDARFEGLAIRRQDGELIGKGRLGRVEEIRASESIFEID